LLKGYALKRELAVQTKSAGTGRAPPFTGSSTTNGPPPALFQKGSENTSPKSKKTNSQISPNQPFQKVRVEKQVGRRELLVFGKDA
jgi:hypothetical protein